MIQSRNWPQIERLPERDDVVIMTSTGYVRAGHHTRTVPQYNPQPTKRRTIWQRVRTSFRRH